MLIIEIPSLSLLKQTEGEVFTSRFQVLTTVSKTAFENLFEKEEMLIRNPPFTILQLL